MTCEAYAHGCRGRVQAASCDGGLGLSVCYEQHLAARVASQAALSPLELPMALIRILLLIVFGIVTLPIRLLLRRGRFSGNIALFPADDPGLAAAKAEAVATVPELLRRLSAPGTDLSSAAVKAALKVPTGTEHVWLTSIRAEGDDFVGTVDNDPSAAAGVRAGEIVRVRQSEISDWKLIYNGQMIGGFTIRYFLSRMPARQREAIIAGLPFTIGPDAIPRAA